MEMLHMKPNLSLNLYFPSADRNKAFQDKWLLWPVIVFKAAP